LEKAFQNIPFLRITIALILGVITGQYFVINEMLNILFLIVVFILLLFINLKYSYSSSVYFGLLVSVFFLLLGIQANTIYYRKPVLHEKGVFSAIVLESPVEKPKSYKSVVKINEVILGDSVKPTNEKVIVYFGKTPEAENLEAGDRILFSQVPQLISPKLNPYDFDFRKYYERKKIYRQVYLRADKWYNTGLKEFSLVCKAEKFRNKLIDIYREQPLDSVEFEVLSALTLGYSRELDPETRRVFSSSGAMHVLSVSGLHVGIIFTVLSFLLAFLKKKQWGKWIFVGLVVVILWFYAFITGLSPSVLRASAMFSVYIIGTNMNKRSNIYNSLALTAFFLLLINPGNLFDIGFQLSYAALFGIVFLQSKFEKVIVIRNKVLKYFAALITVSIAAQITTFPITSYYFGQFPSYFWITNLFIIPLTGFLTPVGILLLFVSKLPVVAGVIAFILNNTLKLSLYLLTAIENLPLSVIPVTITQLQLFLLIFIFIFFFRLLVKFRPLTIKVMILLIVLLNMSFIVGEIIRQKTSQIIVYDHSGKATLHLISGKTNYLITGADFQNDAGIRNSVNSTLRKLGIKAPVVLSPDDNFADENMMIKDRKIVFSDHIIVFGTDSDPPVENAEHLIYVNPPVNFTEKKFTGLLTIVFTGRNKYRENTVQSEIYFTSINGAYRKNW
jgi:competence protein ComEC